MDVGEVSFSPTFKLTHVYHIPSFKFNLISVPHLTKSPPCVAYFTSSICYFRDLYRKTVIGQAKLKDGLYQLQLDSSLEFSSCFSNKLLTNKLPLDAWHCRLGHPNGEIFRFLCQTYVYIRSGFSFYCYVCPQAKQTRLAFNKGSISTTYCFQIPIDPCQYLGTIYHSFYLRSLLFLNHC